MFEEFARNIEARFAENGGAAAEPAADEAEERPAEPEPRGAARPAAAAPPEDDGGGGPALDVVGTFGGPAVEKAVPVLVAAVLAFVYGILVGRLRESRATVQRMARLL